ncbi:hypothetical protein V2J09_021444, partial [Rumex salicifolius]
GECSASETLNVINSKIRDKFFSLLVDDAHDCSVKEQMAIVLRYYRSSCTEDGRDRTVQDFSLNIRLIELALVFPVATAIVERAFSAMNIVKIDLHNKIRDEFLTGSLVCYLEKDVL